MARTYELTGLVTERYPSGARSDQFELTIYAENGTRLTAIRCTENIAPKVGTKYAVVIAPERNE